MPSWQSKIPVAVVISDLFPAAWARNGDPKLGRRGGREELRLCGPGPVSAHPRGDFMETAATRLAV